MTGEEAKASSMTYYNIHKHPQMTVISISMEPSYETQVLVLMV